MLPDQRASQNRWLLILGGSCIATGIVAGSLLMTGVIGGGGGDDEESPRPAATAAPTATGSTDGADGETADGPEIVSWGQEGRQLALVVRNDSDQVISQARLRIVGLNASGSEVVSTVGPENNVCCTILGLPPGEEFGVYAPIGPAAGEITDVTVEYVSKETRAPRAQEPRIVARDPQLTTTADNTVVTTEIKANGPVSDFVAAQAILVDAEGNLVQVISGRYWCYEPGTKKRIRLQLFRAVPDGLHVDRVVAHSIPDDFSPGVAASC